MLAAAALLAAQTLSPHPSVQVYGPRPDPSCGTWTAAREAETPDAMLMQMWLLGFISGFNWFSPVSGGGVRASIDHKALHAWVDQYCREHPLDLLLTAADRLAIELQRRNQPAG